MGETPKVTFSQFRATLNSSGSRRFWEVRIFLNLDHEMATTVCRRLVFWEPPTQRTNPSSNAVEPEAYYFTTAPSGPYLLAGEIRLIFSRLSVCTRSQEQMELIAVIFAFQHLRSRSKCLLFAVFRNFNRSLFPHLKSLTCIFQNNNTCLL